jgi:hypothetical protein
MKAASSATLQLILAVLTIIGSTGGAMIWLNGKFEAQSTQIAEQGKTHGKREAEMQRQIDSLRAALQAMSVSQPRPTRELVRDLMVTKAARVPVKGMQK